LAVDLQSLALKRLIDEQSIDFFNKLSPDYFSAKNKSLFKRIQKFYGGNLRIPSAEELHELIKVETLKHYLDNRVMDEENDSSTIDTVFISEQLQDAFIRSKTISFLDDFVDDLDVLERTEIIDTLQDHLLLLNRAIPEGEEVFDVVNLETVPEEDSFIMYPSGLNPDYDSVNGGFGQQELVLLGGRRGSGKSIIATNLAKNKHDQGDSVLFMSVEMRYKEVYYRLMSMLSKVPFSSILLNKLTPQEKFQIASAKLETFYEGTSGKRTQLLQDLKETKDYRRFDALVGSGELKFKDNRFIIIDNPQLTVARIDHFLNMFTKKHNVKMCVVDYLNIIQTEDRMNWQSQITLADSLKLLARKYDVTMLSPYQIDASGEARFAKGILDSADRSFRFMPPDLDGNPDIIPFDIAKIRNGKAMKFDVFMDWETLSIDYTTSYAAPTGMIMDGQDGNGVIKGKYGSETAQETRRDLSA